jgi:hypothetical protein
MKSDGKWKEYFQNHCKKQASENYIDKLSYGGEVYSSPIIPAYSDSEIPTQTRWLVMEYEGEFNVFLERNRGGKNERTLAASFAWKDTALKFALEMVLIFSGKLKRKGFV